MKGAIRVLHVFYGLDSGGVSNYVMNLYRNIDTDRIQFDFAMTSGKKALFDDEVLARGGRVFYFESQSNLAEGFRKILRENGPFDAVHSHLFFFSGILLREAKRAGIPIRIAHAHNAYTGETRSHVRALYEKSMQLLIRMNATHMLGCSQKACRYVFGEQSMRDKRTQVVPDGIDCGRFAFCPEIREQVRKEYGLQGRYVVGHVGHFNPAKNHEKILDVFQELCQLRDDAALLLVGDGELEEEVKERVKELGISDRVIFAGAHKDVECFYQAMDVFLFPSRYEGFGMAMIEAQSSGLLCVASDVVPQETNVSGRSVYLPLEEDAHVWAQHLTAAVRDESSAAFVSVAAVFDAHSTSKEIERLYLRNDSRWLTKDTATE